MPYLERMTFTGVDEKTDTADLIIMNGDFKYSKGLKDHRLIEFGFLYSHKNQGKENRYPSLEFLKKMGKLTQSTNLDFALHLCGVAATDYIIKRESEIFDLADMFDRVQLNINSIRLQKEGININLLAEKILEAQWLAPKIIVQYNTANIELCRLLANPPNHIPSLLIDSSGGLGTSPESWPEPLENSYCSYAGGLGPDNLLDELKKISKVSDNRGNIIGIDMESKIRTDDWFDLKKVKSCLDIWDTFESM